MRKFSLTLYMVFVTMVGICQTTDGDNLFDDSYLHEFRFELVDTNTLISTKDYQQVNMIVDGVVVESVGIKKKGNISQYSNPAKKAIKIKTNKYVNGKKYDGIKEFMLHMNYQDPTMLREKLTYDICSDMGLFSLRTAFAKVYIDDEYWGLYTLVEGKDEMYKQVFDNRDMDAIESLDFGEMCYVSDDPIEYDYWNNSSGLPYYQFENGDPETAWPRFATMMDKINNTADNQYMDTASTYLNLEHFFIYQAINVYLMNMDSYIQYRGNQIFVYDTISNIWQVTPWDFNASFGLWGTDLYTCTSYEMIPEVISDGCVTARLNTFPVLKEYYLDAMCQLVNTIGDTTTYFSKIDGWKEQIQDAVYDDYRKHFTNEDFDKGLEYGYYQHFFQNQPALKTFLSARLAIVQEGLENEGYACSTVGVAKVEKSRQLNLFPNPASSVINLDFEDDTFIPESVKIMNTLGQLVLDQAWNGNHINIEHLQAGVYFLTLDENIGLVKKIIVE